MAVGAPGMAAAASFDCEKATAAAEKIICRDPGLSRADEALSRLYEALTRLTPTASLRNEQRNWLRERNACRDRDCVERAYRARLVKLHAQLKKEANPDCNAQIGLIDGEACSDPLDSLKPDPFSDAVITCDEMRKYPELIFTGSIDLGSGVGSPVEVDYDCKESVASLPFMKPLMSLAEEIRGEGELPQVCTGTIGHAHWRGYRFELLEAGFAPERMAAHQREDEASLVLYPQLRPGARDEYFQRWAYEGLYNFRLLREYKRERQRVLPLLAARYANVFGYDQGKALELAQRALGVVDGRAYGTFPRDSMPDTERLLSIVAKLDDRDTLETLGQDDARYALNVALLTRQPSQTIALLVGRAGGLNYGDESPLFFALESTENTLYLLARGADVDYANSFGKTPLFYAIGMNDRRLVALLLDHRASIRKSYAMRETPTEPNCIGIRLGRTPLMHAAQHADVSILKLLLDRGAAKDAVDAGGWNAADYALAARQDGNAAFLRSIGVRSLVVEAEQARAAMFDRCNRAVEGVKDEKERVQTMAACLREHQSDLK